MFIKEEILTAFKTTQSSLVGIGRTKQDSEVEIDGIQNLLSRAVVDVVPQH